MEQRIPGTFITRDLYGVGDVLCVGDDIVLVQSTSMSNIASRIRKITDSESTPILRKAGIRILVHGWAKKGGRWVYREDDIS